MSSVLAQLATKMEAAIVTKRDNGNYVDNSFTTERTYMPIATLESIEGKPRVILIPLPVEDTVLTRGNSYQKDAQVQVGIQCGVDNSDDDEIDKFLELEEEIRHTLLQTFTLDTTSIRFSPQSIEPLTDESGTPFNYTGMREGSVFEVYFTVTYACVIDNSLGV